MPITIQWPTAGAQFGPGTFVDASSDFIWTDHPNARWQVGIISEDGQFIVERQAFFASSPITYWFLTNNRATSTTTQSTVPWPVADTPVTVQIEIADPDQVYETASTQARWNPTFQLGWQQYLQQTTTTGGFTAEDRANLQLAVDGVTVDAFDHTVPADLHSIPIGKLRGQYPLVWNDRVGPFILTGRGRLNLQAAGVSGLWTGFRWFYTVIPPGWGMTPGAIDEFDNRPAQLAAVYILASGEEIADPILDTNSSGGFQALQLDFTTQSMLYDVAPGFSVTLFMYRLIGSG